MRPVICATMLAAIAGCHAYTLDVEGRIAQRAAYPIDVMPDGEAQVPRLQHDSKHQPKFMGTPIELVDATNVRQGAGTESTLLLVAQKEVPPDKSKLPEKDIQAGKGKPSGMADRMRVPADLLGFEVPDLASAPAKATPEERAKLINKQYPPLSEIPRLPLADAGPNGRPYTLSDLQQIALSTNPLIRQAHLDVDAARGLALQAGLYPNPIIAYEGSSIGQGNNNGNRSAGQQGGSIEQTIVTMRKLQIARDAAQRDVDVSEQKLKATEADLQAQVRSGYFAVLSAQKNYQVTKALTKLTDELYYVLLDQLRVGEIAQYEPMQIRVLSGQARGSMVQAYNRYVSAWKQLAATLGTPTMPLTTVAGQIDMPLPLFEYDRVLAFVLANHTDVLSAQLSVDKARSQLRLAEVQPYPDVTVHVGVQKDYTTPPFSGMANVSVGVPFPLWNRNQGNIQAADAQLRRALQDNLRVRNDLSGRVAEVFERYNNNRILLKLYRDQILPNQVLAFRGAVIRHANFGGKLDVVGYNDLVTSQQTLATLIATYLGALNDSWTSVVDIAHLLQTRDLFQLQPMEEVAPIPEVTEILRPRFMHHR